MDSLATGLSPEDDPIALFHRTTPCFSPADSSVSLSQGSGEGVSLPVSYIERELEDLIDYCEEVRYRGDLLINDSLVRRRLVNLKQPRR